MSRASAYTPELAASIVERLHERSLVQICQEDKDVPDRTTIQRWISRYPDFASAVSQARSEHAQFLIEKTLIEVQNCTEDNFRSTKVKIESAQWLAERLKSHEYGSKVQVNAAVIHLSMPTNIAADYATALSANPIAPTIDASPLSLLPSKSQQNAHED